MSLYFHYRYNYTENRNTVAITKGLINVLIFYDGGKTAQTLII